jgi:hypothetical protein
MNDPTEGGQTYDLRELGPHPSPRDWGPSPNPRHWGPSPNPRELGPDAQPKKLGFRHMTHSTNGFMGFRSKLNRIESGHTTQESWVWMTNPRELIPDA